MQIKSELKHFAHHIDIKLPSKPHLTLGVRQFCRDYSFPLYVTAGFVFIVLSVFLLRSFERSSLADLLPGASGGDKDYATLISGDKAAVFSKNDEAAETNNSQQTNTPVPAGTTGSFSINPETSGPSGQTGGGSGGGGGTSPQAQFSASIAAFQFNNVTLVCTNPDKPNKGTCSKRYTYNGSISTQNGPGTVTYSWLSNIPGASSTGSTGVGGGSQTTSVQKEFTLGCNSGGSYTLQLRLNSPSQAVSRVETVNHHCNDI